MNNLTYEISVNAKNASSSLNSLVNSLGKVEASLHSVNSRGLSTLASGVNRLSNAMKNFSGNTKTADFSRLARNLNSLSNIKSSEIHKASSALTSVASSLKTLNKTNVAANSVKLTEFATSVRKLGYSSTIKAIDNMPKLATSLKALMQTLSKAPKVSQNLIQMTNALANFSSQGRKIGSASNQIISGLNGTTTATEKAKSGFRSFASIIGKFYASYFLLIRGAKGLWSSIESSMDYIETLNYFDAAFGQVADTAVKNWKEAGYNSAEEYYNSFSERAKVLTSQMSGYEVLPTGELKSTGQASLGIDPNQLMNYQATYAQMSSSIGATAEQAIKLSRVLTEIGADLASVKNMDFDQTWNDMASGLAGMSRTLDKYGVNIRNVNLQQQLTNAGIKASVMNLNQNEKALIRATILLNSSKYAWGDLAKTLNQPANQLRLLQSNFKNLSRTIGNLFLPIVSKILPYINGLTIALQRLFNWIGKSLGIDISKITSAVGNSSVDFGSLLDDAEDFSDNIETASDNVKKLKNNLNTISIDKLNIISKEDNQTTSNTGGSKGLSDADLSKLNDAFDDAYEKYQKAWDKAFAGADNKALEIADKITNAFKKGDYKGIGKYISNGLTKSLKTIPWNSIYKGASKFGIGLAQFLNGLITPELFYQLGKTIAKTLGTQVEFALNFFSELDWGNVGESFAQGINGFFENFPFSDLAKTINKFVDGLQDMIANFIKNVNWAKILKGAFDFASNLEIDTILVIPMLSMLKKIKGNTEKTSKSILLNATKIKKGFKNLFSDKQSIGTLNSLKKNGISTFNALKNSMSGTTKAMIGSGGLIAAFSGLKNATEGITNGTKTVISGLGQMALSAGVAGAALYTAFGPVGLAVGAVVGLSGAIYGVIHGIEEVNQKEIALKFSEESGLKISDLNDRLKSTLKTTRELPKEFQNNAQEMKTASEDVKSSLDNLTVIGNAIKNSEDTSIASAQNISDAFKKLQDSSQEYLDNSYANTILSLQMNKSILENQGINVESEIQKITDEYTKNTTKLKKAIKIYKTEIEKGRYGSKRANEAYLTIQGYSGIEIKDSKKIVKKAKKALNTNAVNFSDYFNQEGIIDQEGLETAFNEAKSTYEKQLNNLNDYWNKQIKTLKEKNASKEIIKAYKKQKKADVKELFNYFNEIYTTPLQEALISGVVDATKGIDAYSATELISKLNRTADKIYNPVVDTYIKVFEDLGIKIDKLDNDTLKRLLNGLIIEEDNGLILKVKNNYEKILNNFLKAISFEDGAKYIKNQFNTVLFAGINGVSIDKARTMIQNMFSKIFTFDVEMNLGMQLETPATKTTGDWFSGEQKAWYLNNDKQIKEWAKKNNKIKFSLNPFNANGLEGGLRSAEIFFANENGRSELIGRVGNKTGVANSEQIMNMVSNGVARAVADVIVPVISNDGAGEKTIVCKTYLNDKEIAKSVNKVNARRGANIIGGENGYLYR